jgi:hypothetical protein
MIQTFEEKAADIIGLYFELSARRTEQALFRYFSLDLISPDSGTARPMSGAPCP